MKTKKVIYWITTSVIGSKMVFSAFNYFTSTEATEGMKRLGFQPFFVKELGFFKILGVLALFIPQVPIKIKEWAYAGFGIVFISAFWAHVNAGDPVSIISMPLIFLVLLTVSNIYLHKIKVSK